MTRGRKPIQAPEETVIDATEVQQAAQALATMRETAITEQQEQISGVFSLGQNVGAALMANMIKNFSAAAEVRAFEEINKSKAFKHLQIKMPDGVLRPAESIDEFCRVVFGKGYKAMNNHKVMLQQLGEEAYENAGRLNLNRSQLRMLLTLPEDERTAVEEAMRDGGGKDEVVTLIQSLANKLDETREQVEQLKGELTATEEISAEKTAEIERLREERVRIRKQPPDQVRADLAKEIAEHVSAARDKLATTVRSGFFALGLHYVEHGGTDCRHLMAGHVAELQKVLNELREEFNLRDLEGDGRPEWMDWPATDEAPAGAEA